MEHRLRFIIATWFGSGLIRPILVKGMAGTYGSIAAIPLCILALSTGVFGYGICVVAVYLQGVWSIPYTEKILGPQTDWKGHTRTHDQNQIVIDEVLGMLIACLPLLFYRSVSWWFALPLACLLFRVFDIAKPWPVRYFDTLHTPAGVMLDDAMAGLYAAAVLYIVLVTVF